MFSGLQSDSSQGSRNTALLGLLLKSSKLTNPQEADIELKHERAGRSGVSFKPQFAVPACRNEWNRLKQVSLHSPGSNTPSYLRNTQHNNVSCDSVLLVETGGVVVQSFEVRRARVRDQNASAVGHQRDKKASFATCHNHGQVRIAESLCLGFWD